MIYFEFMTPEELMRQIATCAKEKRLSLNFTQQTLAERSGVSLGVLKNFERTGKISLKSLLKLALPLESLTEFADLFKAKPIESFPNLDAILNQKSRKRGRR